MRSRWSVFFEVVGPCSSTRRSVAGLFGDTKVRFLQSRYGIRNSNHSEMILHATQLHGFFDRGLFIGLHHTVTKLLSDSQVPQTERFNRLTWQFG
jgi:hypothetical protein